MRPTDNRTPEAISVESEIERFERLLKYDGSDQIVLNADFYREKIAKKEETKKFYTGFAELDSYLDGFAEGELVVITGLFGNGKTLFSKTLIKSFSSQNIPCVVFSMEDPTLNFIESYISDGLEKYPFAVPRENIAGNTKWLEERIIEAKVKYNCKIVLIDHLHFIVEMGTEYISMNIGAVMRRLAILAGLEKMVIFIVCHQKSIGDVKFNVEPSLQHCRDSSAIPQECSTGLVVHRMKDKDDMGNEFDSYEQGYCWVKIDKARRTGTYRKKITFQKRGNWLEPV